MYGYKYGSRVNNLCILKLSFNAKDSEETLVMVISAREDKPRTRLAATKTVHSPPSPPPDTLFTVAQWLWNLTITISYYCFLAKAEKHWRNSEKLLSRLSDWVMFAKDKFILQLNLVGSSSSQTFFIIVFIKRDFV